VGRFVGEELCAAEAGTDVADFDLSAVVGAGCDEAVGFAGFAAALGA
jgi:hypothetical protein